MCHIELVIVVFIVCFLIVLYLLLFCVSLSVSNTTLFRFYFIFFVKENETPHEKQLLTSLSYQSSSGFGAVVAFSCIKSFFSFNLIYHLLLYSVFFYKNWSVKLTLICWIGVKDRRELFFKNFLLAACLSLRETHTRHFYIIYEKNASFLINCWLVSDFSQ